MDNNLFSNENLELFEYLLEDEGVELSNQGTIKKLENREEMPLSFAQQRLWFLAQIESNSPAYNLASALRLDGNLDIKALEESLTEIIQRHEVLRTSFNNVNGKPVQVIHSSLNFEIPIINLSFLSEEEQKKEVERLANQEAKQPFALEKAPLIRIKILELRKKDRVMLFNMHHIVADAWSKWLFLGELTKLYEAFSTGKSISLPELPIQYADFASWQRQWLEGEEYQKQLNYWQEKLQNSSPLELPNAKSRPKLQTFEGAVKSFEVSSNLREKLQNLAASVDATLFMTLLTAFVILLHRYTDRDDISVGSPIANRNQSEVESLIGFFLNTLVFRNDLSGNPSFRELLIRVKEVAMEAYGHQELPFEILVEHLQPQRNLSHTPLFQVMFTLQSSSSDMQNLSLGDVKINLMEISNVTAKFDLSLNMEESKDCLKGFFEYNTDLFDDETIYRMVIHFENLLESIVSNPSETISNLEILSSKERQQLLIDWNKTDVEYPKNLCLHQLVENQVKQSPNCTAITFFEQHLTYGELNKKANQLAHYLQNNGVNCNSLVGICVERSLDMVVGLLGILKAGAAYVPLDPNYPVERLKYMLEDARLQVVLTQKALVKKLEELKETIFNPNLNSYKIIDIQENWQEISKNSKDNLPNSTKPSNLAYIIYTSGSTGKPKGVQIPHKAVVNFLNSMKEKPRLTRQDTLLSVTTLSFDIAALEIFLPLIVGGKLVLVNREIASDGMKLAEAIDKSQASILQATPATWQMLLNAQWQGNKNLKILCGGESLSDGLAKKLLEKGSSVWNMYGPTETTIWSLIHKVEKVSRIIPIGRPINNTQVYILNRYLQPVSIGIPGELYIGGEGIAKGYLNRPDLTEERFISNPFNPSETIYKTGDLARYLPNGTIECLGRIDYQVKIRGFRIELGEIETILDQYQKVEKSVIVAQEDGNNLKRLVGYLVPAKKETPTITELRSFLQQKLPDYMIPSAFVILQAFPLTPNGKIDRRALPKANVTRNNLEKPFIPPRNPTEEVVADIWFDILGVEAGMDDNFFELGGHSLLATQVISRIRQTFGVELALRVIFESPTVGGLSDLIQQAINGNPATIPSIKPLSQRQNISLSFAQQRLWFLEQLEKGNTSYIIPSAVRIKGNINLNAVEWSINKIIQRHEALRTTFALVEGNPVQIVAPSLTLEIPLLDLGVLEEKEIEKEVQRIAIEEGKKSFDLEKGPLLRVKLLRLGELEYVALFTMHHIISDVWSMGVLMREFTTLYQAFCENKPSPLAELPIQYGDFAVWQHDWLQGEVLQNQLDYWRQQLSPLPKLNLEKIEKQINPIALKTSRDSDKGFQSFLLPSASWEKIKQLSRQEGVTPFMVVLTALQTLLYRYLNQEDIVVGIDIANRNHPRIEALIGFFVNILLIRTDLSGNPQFRELLLKVKETTLKAYAYQDLPFAKLVEAFQPKREVNQTPLFQVLLVFQNAPMPALEFSGLTLTPLNLYTGKAKFDLILFIQETKEGILGIWKYNSDLLTATTITSISNSFQTLINSILDNPNKEINNLTMVTENQKKQQLAETQKRQKTKFNKFKKFMSVKPKKIGLPKQEFIKTSYLQEGETLPLVIEPNIDELDVFEWAKNQREYIENQLLKHGAILFRGFKIETISDFQNLAQSICPNLFSEYGDLPREGISDKVYGSTPYPANKAILFHNESSHLNSYPNKIWFMCVKPAKEGGETPIIDCRKLYQILDPKLRKKFQEKQLMYVRNYTEGLDVSWENFFHTKDKQKVEEYCHKSGIKFEWLPNNGLKTSKICPAIITHPKTEELVFFNQIQLHHFSYLESTIRESLLSSFGLEGLPRNVYYGDGTPIEDEVINTINALYQQTSVQFPWQKGDILMLDNILTAHSRNPYKGARKIVVAMGDIIHRN